MKQLIPALLAALCLLLASCGPAKPTRSVSVSPNAMAAASMDCRAAGSGAFIS